MKVLQLITWLAHGGIENWLLGMARTIPRRQCAMDFCCKGSNVGGLAGEARELGASVLHCPLWPLPNRFVRGLRQILVRGKYDLLHVHLDAHDGLPVYVANSIGVPVVITFHNTQFTPCVWWTKLPVLRQLRALYAGWSVQYAVNHATLVTGVSRGVLESVYGKQGGVLQDCRVLYLGSPAPAPLNEEQKAALRAGFGVPPTAPLVLHVAGFATPKNHLGLLQIFERVAAVVPHSHLAMVGDGVLRKTVEGRAGRSAYRERIHFLGQRGDVPALMQASDVFVFPSLHEGLPVVLIEAQAAGLPIVASRIPGITEAVQDSVSAILHEPTAVEQMAASTAAVLTTPARAKALGEGGRQRYLANFTQEAAAARLLQVYADCLNRKASSGTLGNPTR